MAKSAVRELPGRQPKASRKASVAAQLFRVWLDAEFHLRGLQRHDVAKQLRVAPQYPGMLANGRATPSLTLATKIQELTCGVVRAVDWRVRAAAPVKTATRRVA